MLYVAKAKVDISKQNNNKEVQMMKTEELVSIQKNKYRIFCGGAFCFDYREEGYEPIDKNLLSRQFIYSTSVPIEIVLISTKQLARTKTDIEDKSRKNAEKRCRQQMIDLKKRLDAQQISNADYQKKTQELEKQMKTFEFLIAAMADHYARTDYNELDSLNAAINECIVNGELEKADSLINIKGDVKKRANENIAKGKQLHRAERLLDSLTNVTKQEYGTK